MTGDMPLVRLRNVSKTYRSIAGDLSVLSSVSLDINAGEFMAVLGPSGSGKSTFLNLVGLLDTPSAGQIYFRGKDVSSLSVGEYNDLRKTGIGMVFQSFHLLPNRTALENVLFRFHYLDVPYAAAVRASENSLREMGLAPVISKPVRLLSGGEMQRVAIARALVVAPALLLADEPTGNLDLQTALTIMECFHRLHLRGTTIVLATHNTALLKYCSRVMACSNQNLEPIDKRSPHVSDAVVVA
jgi:putative ABC transport system ATP-binding protein